MKPFIIAIFSLCLLTNCSHEKSQIVNNSFIDSLITHYNDTLVVQANDSAMAFWKSRINPKLPGIVSESKYAGALSERFRLFGDIADIKMADSVMQKEDLDFNHKEAATNLTLVRYSILQHRFKDAETYFQKAIAIGIKKYDLLTTTFDVDFELGNYNSAANSLKELKSSADYAYFFRRSKMDHLNGMLDSSINAMLQAASLAEGNKYLKQVALSNAADLCIHADEMQKATDFYKQSIYISNTDFHSMMGLGWIALVHDKNDSLAEKIFKFVASKNKLPDPLFKLIQTADERGDTNLQKKYSMDYEKKATDSVYGNMYNKYMIELYTGILNEPAKAEIMSKNELDNRATPQTYSWYVWCLFNNNKKDEAYKIFEKYVSGKPLEGLELYWMGKMMKGLNKGYNAENFFKAAYKNKYDLSPGIVKDLEKNLE